MMFAPPPHEFCVNSWLKARGPNIPKQIGVLLFVWTVLLPVSSSAVEPDCPDPLPSNRICEEVDSNSGDLNIIISDATIESTEDRASGIWGIHQGKGHINIDFSGERITTTGEQAYGIYGFHQETGDINIKFSSGSLKTEGYFAHGIVTDHRNTGTVDIGFTGGSISTKGNWAFGIHVGTLGNGDTTINFTGGSLKTEGLNARGIAVSRRGIGNININFTGGSLMTMGSDAHGIFGRNRGTGDVNIKFSGGSISTAGDSAYGIYGMHQPRGNGSGDINIILSSGSLRTEGQNAHGIVLYQSSLGSSDAEVKHINALGADSHGLVFGKIKQGTTDEIELAAPLDRNFYRKQTVRINGRVMGGTGTGAGVYMAGGGRIAIGSQGFLGAHSGVAIFTEGNNGNNSPRKLYVNLEEANGRPWERLGGRIINDGDSTEAETILAVNQVKVFQNAPLDVWAPSGFHEVKLNSNYDFSTLDFSQEEAWLRRYGIKAGLFEALPGVIRRIHTVPCSFMSNRQSSVGGCGSQGKYTPKRSDTGISYTYNQRAFQIHFTKTLSDQMTGWIGVRQVYGEAKITSASRQGQLKVEGPGSYGGLYLERDNDIYWQAQFSWSHYDVNLYQTPYEGEEAATNTGSTNGEAYSLDLEVGKVFVLNNKTQLRGHGWYHQAGASVEAFEYTQLDDLASGKDRMSKIGLGLRVVQTRELVKDESHLELRYGIGLEHVIGDDSHATWSGTKISNAAKKNRLLVDLGSDYHWVDHVLISGNIFAHGLLSDDVLYGLKVRISWSF